MIIILFYTCFQFIIFTMVWSTGDFKAAPPPSLIQQDNKSKKVFSLDDVTSNAYTSLAFNGSWISETEIFYRIDELLLIFDILIQQSEIIANSSIFDDEDDLQYSLSPDRNFVLIRNQTKKVYRYSSLNQFGIYSIKNKSLKFLENGQLISIAVWTPHGSDLIYVFKNDIYHHQSQHEETRRLTFDGSLQSFYNGVPDWVYEEEVYSNDEALWISPNGNYLAFATFNDTRVPETVVMRFGKPSDMKNQYPSLESFRYPKAGAVNPIVTLNVINLKDKHSSLISLRTPDQKDIRSDEAILYTVTWFDEKTVVATWSNRVQNQSLIVTYSIVDNETHNNSREPRVLLEQKVTDGWLLHPDKAPLYCNKGYVLIFKAQPVANKTLGYFSHVTRFTLKNHKLENEFDLTPGETWVYSINGVNEKNGLIYYTASIPGKPSQRQLFKVELEPKKNTKPKCISCEHKTPEGNDCKYVSTTEFSLDLSRYVLSCTGPDPTIVKIYESKNDLELYTWIDNYSLRQMLDKRVLPQKIDLTIPLNGFDVAVRLRLPQNFDPLKKYPLHVNVYAGPGSQAIIDAFSVGYEMYATTAKNIITADIDGRGSNSRGTALLYSVYRNLGTPEILDQIEATKYLLEKYSWIDANRTAIGGWSYGGYSTAMILTKDKDNVFKCGHSGAPVTHWMYYDSIYTERYMGLPTLNDNYKNYQESSVMRRAKNLKGKKFILIHGTADDNVHFQHSMALTRVLTENNIMFEQFVYPDEAHSFVHLSQHLSQVIDNFINRCFWP